MNQIGLQVFSKLLKIDAPTIRTYCQEHRAEFLAYLQTQEQANETQNPVIKRKSKG